MALQSKLIVIVLVLLFFSSCSSIEGGKYNVLVLVDVTMSSKDQIPDAERILADMKKFVDLESEEHIYDGLNFSIGVFDDLSGQRMQSVEVEPLKGNTALDNPIKRKKEMAKFLEKISDAVNKVLENTDIDRQQSKIYNKLCSSLPNVPANADKTYVLIYSDMLENSELASFYKLDIIKSAANDPNSFYDKNMKRSCDLPNLENTNIALYASHTAATDVLVIQAEKFWSSILRKKGATVSVNP